MSAVTLRRVAAGARLHVLLGKGTHALGELHPERRDDAEVVAVEDVEAAALRGERLLLCLEEAPHELALGADQIGVLGGDDDAAAGAERNRVERRAQLHVRVEQRDELLLRVDLLEEEHDGRRLVVARVADLVNQRMAKAHIVVHKRRTRVQARVIGQLLRRAGKQARDVARLLDFMKRVI